MPEVDQLISDDQQKLIVPVSLLPSIFDHVAIDRFLDALHDLGGDRINWPRRRQAQAFNLDFTTMVTDYTPWVFAFVPSLSFVLLLVAFRSIVVPFTFIVMNLPSVGAADGLMVLVFQRAILEDALGLSIGCRRLKRHIP